MTTATLPPMPADFEPTRATLHAYANAVGAIPRVHAIPHAKWWHISLSVRPEGLTTDPIPLPDGGALTITLDANRHTVVVRASGGTSRTIDLTTRPTGTEVGEALATATAELGLEDKYDRERFASTEPRTYNLDAATGYFDAFVAVANVFEQRRATLADRVSPVQLWPHGFDLSFEWFGTRTVESEAETLPAQLNLGFYPGGAEPYFYSNPWPFPEELTATNLPPGANWHREGWSGAYLPYRVVRESAAPAATLHEFAAAVFTAARPSLDL